MAKIEGPKSQTPTSAPKCTHSSLLNKGCKGPWGNRVDEGVADGARQKGSTPRTCVHAECPEWSGGFSTGKPPWNPPPPQGCTRTAVHRRRSPPPPPDPSPPPLPMFEADSQNFCSGAFGAKRIYAENFSARLRWGPQGDPGRRGVPANPPLPSPLQTPQKVPTQAPRDPAVGLSGGWFDPQQFF